MKKLLSVAAVAALGVSLSQVASASYYQTIYDNDGANRDTNYQNGPVTTVRTDGSGTSIAAYIFRDDYTSRCTTANLYTQNGDWLANAPVYGADIRGTTQRVDFSTSGEQAVLQANKYIELSCNDDAGKNYLVRHNVPGAPTVTWTANVTASGAWVPPNSCGLRCNPGHGVYESLAYQGSLNVNNKSSEGVCYVERDDLAVGVFHGNDYRANFHSDVFTSNKTVDAYTPPALVQRVSCYNPGGTTTLVKVWQVTNDTIELIEDINFSR